MELPEEKGGKEPSFKKNDDTMDKELDNQDESTKASINVEEVKNQE